MKFSSQWVLLLYCFPSCWTVQGQNPYEIHWSEPQKSDKDFISGDIIHADSNGILLIRQEIEEYYGIGSSLQAPVEKKFPPVLEYYTTDLKHDYAFELKGWSASEEEQLIQAGESEGHFDHWYYPFWTNGKPWFAYSNYNREDKTTSILVREIDLNKRKLAGTPIEIFDIKDNPTEYYSGNGRRVLERIVDETNSKIMFYTCPDFSYPNRFNVKIVDRKMKSLWAKEYDLPFAPNALEVQDFCLSVTGSFYCLARIYEILPGKATYFSESDQSSFATIILEFTSNSEKANMYRLDLDGKVLLDANLIEDKDGQIHCIGGYTLDKYTRFYGIVDFVLNPFEQSISKRGPIPFSQPLLRKISLAENTAKNPFVEAYRLFSLHLNMDGTAKILGFYDDHRGSHHAIRLEIDSQFQEIKGTRIKKSQLVNRPSDWIFAGSDGILYFKDNDIIVFNDNVPGANQINILESSGGESSLFHFPQPDSENNLLFVCESLIHAPDGRIYLIGETRDHKMYRVGYIQRKP